MMAIARMVTNIGCARVEAAAAFYRDVLGFEVVQSRSDDSGMTWALLKQQEVELALFRRQGANAGDAVTLFMPCDDVDALHRKTARMGHDPGGLELTHHRALEFRLRDPDGYTLVFSQDYKSVRMTKQLLREWIEAKYGELMGVIRSLPQPAIEEPGVQGLWSVKDIVAHLAAWHNRQLRWMEASDRGEEPETPEPGYQWEQIHQLNHDTYLKFKDAAYSELLDEFNRSYAAILARIDAWRDEDLNDSERYGWSHGLPLWVMIGYNTFDHYRSHLHAIKRWLAQTDRPLTS